MGHVLRNPSEFDLSDLVVGQQCVAELFSQFAQRPHVNRSVDRNLHHFALFALQANFGLFNLVGESADSAYGLIDVLEGLHPILASH